MRTIICKRCGAPIDADLGECPVCGAVYYILPESDDNTRVWDADTAAKAAEIHAAIHEDSRLDETLAIPTVKESEAAPPKPRQATGGPERRASPVRKMGNRPPSRTWVFIVGATALLAVLALVISSMLGAFEFGAKPQDMPNVMGLTRDVAVNQLRAMGISPNIVYSESEQPNGEVIDQKPLEGQPVKKGGTVTLTVSSGVQDTPEPETYIEVPDVLGDSFDVASARLSALGLIPVKGGEEFHDTAEEGTVTRQSPLSSAKLRAGDKVMLTLSKGKEIKEFKVIITAGKGGIISPSGTVELDEGESLDIVITPDEGYIVRELRINGMSIGAVTEYTLRDISEDFSVYAVFALEPEPDEPSEPPESPEPGETPPVETPPESDEPKNTPPSQSSPVLPVG